MKKEQKKYVYFFGAGQTEGNANMRELLGGKGANLAERRPLVRGQRRRRRGGTDRQDGAEGKHGKECSQQSHWRVLYHNGPRMLPKTPLNML